MTNILDGLTESQREAVTHINGPLLIVAGPGSGKTRVITRRIAHLIYCGIRPWNILAITFTNKAAGEMRERVDRLVTEKGVWLSTFHSFAARHLRTFAERLGYSRDFSIYDSSDSLGAISDAMKECELDKANFKPSAFQSAISDAKGRLLGPEEYAENLSEAGNFFRKKVAPVYIAYQRSLRAANAMDFDDLLMNMGRLLTEDADCLATLQDRHQFILVDEFQDTNPTQYRICSQLAAGHQNLCATGDPDQSIYGWRGADISNILDFENDFPGAKTVFLDQNYRKAEIAENILYLLSRVKLDAAYDLVGDAR